MEVLEHLALVVLAQTYLNYSYFTSVMLSYILPYYAVAFIKCSILLLYLFLLFNLSYCFCIHICLVMAREISHKLFSHFENSLFSSLSLVYQLSFLSSVK